MDVFTLVGKIAIDGMNTVNQQLGGLQDKLKSAGQSMTNMGKQMSMKVTAPIVALGVASFKMAGDFDQAFRAVNVMLRATDEEAAEYKKQILEISDATGKSAIDITEAFYQIVSAGFRGADAIDILNTAVRGSVGGFADAQETTAALTKAMNIFQLEGVEGSSRAMDTFFGIVDTGLLTFEELANAFPRAASNAAGLGISIEETGATLGTLTKYLGTTEQAATATDAVLRTLISPSEALQDLYAKWEVSSGPEAIAQFGGLTGVLEKLKEATGGEVTAIRELFNSDEAMKGILPLLTNAYQDYNAAVVTVTESQGKTNEAFEEAAEGPGFQWQQMMTRLKNASITLGDAVSKTLGPWLEKLMGNIKGLVEWFGNLSPGMQKAIIIIGAIVAAIGPLLLIFGQMALGISALIGLLPALGAAFTAMLGPVGLIIAGIAALIAIGVLVWKNWDTIKEKAKAIWNAIVGFFKDVWRKITGLFKDHWDKILAILFPAIGLPILIARNWGAIVEKVKDIWNRVVEWFKGVPERLGEIFARVKDFILAPFRAAISGIEAGINWLIQQINKIHIEIPDWIPGIGGKAFGFNIPELSLPKFGEGGLIPEPTLLYGLKSKRPYAIAGEEGTEVVSPAGNTMVNNYFQGPWFIREEADIDKIARKLYNLQRRSSLQAGVA